MDTCLERLIQAGASVNESDQKGNSALMMAAVNDHTTCVKQLIKSGADVNITNGSGITSLVGRGNRAHLQCIEILLESGADVNKTEAVDGVSALMGMAFFHSYKGVEMLLKAGADVNMKAKDGTAALFYPVKKNTEKYQKLVEEAGDSYNEDDHDSTKCISILIIAGADVNTSDNQGNTTLFHAAEAGLDECVKHLINAGADVNNGKNSKETPLSIAVNKGHSQVIELLTSAGSDVNSVDSHGNTPLMEAAGSGKLRLIRTFLKLGAKINKTNTLGNNALKTDLVKCHPPSKTASVLLQAAGEDVTTSIFFQIPKFLQHRRVGMQLKHICRQTIRKHLQELDLHQHLFGKIPQLGLPSALKRYLLFNMSLETSAADDDDGDESDEDGDDTDDNIGSSVGTAFSSQNLFQPVNANVSSNVTFNAPKDFENNCKTQ